MSDRFFWKFTPMQSCWRILEAIASFRDSAITVPNSPVDLSRRDLTVKRASRGGDYDFPKTTLNDFPYPIEILSQGVSTNSSSIFPLKFRYLKLRGIPNRTTDQPHVRLLGSKTPALSHSVTGYLQSVIENIIVCRKSLESHSEYRSDQSPRSLIIQAISVTGKVIFPPIVLSRGGESNQRCERFTNRRGEQQQHGLADDHVCVASLVEARKVQRTTFGNHGRRVGSIVAI